MPETNMQNVSESNESRVLVLEASPERGAWIADRLLDRGIDASFVEKPQQLFRALQDSVYHVVFLADSFGSSEEILSIAKQIKDSYSLNCEIILCSDRIRLADCHAAGCATLIRKALDFTEICDLVERLSESNGKRLYDGTQVRIANRLGRVSGQVTSKGNSQEIQLAISEIGRGGFFYETDSQNAQHLEEGSIIHFDLHLSMFPNYSFKGKGMISWTQRSLSGKIGIAVEFVYIPQDSESLIKAFTDLFKIKHFIPNTLSSAS